MIQAIHTVPQIDDPISKTKVFEQNAVEQLIKEQNIERIVCSQEAQLLLAARLREKYQMKGISAHDLIFFRDKIQMKNKVKQKVNVPDAAVVIDFSRSDGVNYYRELSQNGDKKLFAKPIAAVGSRGVYRIFCMDDFLQFFAQVQKENCPYQVEEYIEGTLYHIDIAQQKGKILFAQAGRYSCPNADFQRGKALGSFPLFDGNHLRDRLIKQALLAIEALGNWEGVYHLEMFHTPKDELIFLETAIRPIGLYGVKMYEKNFGVNLYALDFYIQMGVVPPESTYACADVQKTAFLVFPLENKRIEKLKTPTIDSDFELQWRVKVGDLPHPTASNLDFAGFIFIWNQDIAVLEKDFEYLSQDFQPITYENTFSYA